LSRVRAARVAPAPTAVRPQRRRGFLRTYLTPKQAIPGRARATLAVGSFVVVVGVWWLLAILVQNPLFVPSPYQVVVTWWDMMVNLAFYNDVAWSSFRIIAGFLLAALVAVPLGLLMGSFEVVRSFFNPPINAIRYMPASAFIPLLILLQGLGEDEKITIIWIGVFFQLVLMVMDIAHRVPDEMLNVAYTLGASRWAVFSKVFLPATFPEVVDALRITMGWAWTYLIVAEIVSADRGLGYLILNSMRGLFTDRIFVGLITIGGLGLLFDMTFKWLHRRLLPWSPKA